MDQRAGTAAEWQSADPTLIANEIGYETDTGKWKWGDGATAWTSLTYEDAKYATAAQGALADTALQTATIATVSTTTATISSDYTVVLDDTAGALVTVTLPPVSAGALHTIKKLESSFDVVVEGDGAENIDGAANATLTTQYESITVVGSATAWFVV